MLDNFWFNVEYGLNHVLDINGYDHVLFLMVLTVPYVFKDWKRVIILVSTFTSLPMVNSHGTEVSVPMPTALIPRFAAMVEATILLLADTQIPLDKIVESMISCSEMTLP